ncbi:MULTISPECIES: hypothetical protein [Pseudomonas]|jgi:UDP-N-acetylglucosamine 2-epimerase|uniref:hypothetical protein n=1 Tax=Pseudomonas TaxID=286 RepID=UPI001304A1CB|nr:MULTISPECIES: hypothetical protein [Pseudomonas]MCH4902052.1 hypothetical protein [Pseudomonas sp. B707]
MSFNVMMVFGTRPEAIKMAPLARVLRQWPDITLNICSNRLYAWLSARSAAGKGV